MIRSANALARHSRSQHFGAMSRKQRCDGRLIRRKEENIIQCEGKEGRVQGPHWSGKRMEKSARSLSMLGSQSALFAKP